MNERMSSEHIQRALKQHGGICTCTRCLEGRDLLAARAEIVVLTKELTRLSVEIVRAERERDEAMATLVSARESYDLVQKHAPAPVAEMVRGFFVTVPWDAARAAAKEGADDGFSDEGTRSRNRNCDDWIAPRGSHGR